MRARARAQTNTHLSRKGALLHAFASVFEPVQFSLYWPAPSYSSSPLKGRGAKVKHLAGLPERASLAGRSRGIFHSLTSRHKGAKNWIQLSVMTNRFFCCTIWSIYVLEFILRLDYSEYLESNIHFHISVLMDTTIHY